MRLGLLGPAGTHVEALAKAARFLLTEQAVDRAVYLGLDSALDEAVRKWAESLVGGDPSGDAVWARAVEKCVDAEPGVIDEFVAGERERDALRIFESLPSDGARVIEILNGKVAVMIYDKGGLDEEDILAASVLLFGKSKRPVVKQVGPRWFLSPGSFDEGGVLVIEDTDDGLDLTIFDRDLKELGREQIVLGRAAKVRVADATG